MIAGGINWMASRMPKGTRIRSSRYPQDRNEIGNEINWRKRITSNQETHCLGVPRHARVSAREIERMHILFDSCAPNCFNHSTIVHAIVILDMLDCSKSGPRLEIDLV